MGGEPSLAATPDEKLVPGLSERTTLTGNWRGLRAKLDDKGLRFEAVYTGESFIPLSGGVRRKVLYLDNVDVSLTVDGEKSLGWPGGTLFIYGLGNHGADPGDYTGDVQGVSNIAAFDAWKLYEAWVQQNIPTLRLSILAGLYDLNSEFDVIGSANLFINSSHGIGIDFSQSGENGPSIFPTTSAGLRAKWTPSRSFYVQTVVLDGVAGDPRDPGGTRVIFDSGDGVLNATEAAYLATASAPNPDGPDRHRYYRLFGRLAEPEYESKFAVGVWFYSSRFDAVVDVDASGNPARAAGNMGAYLLVDKRVYCEAPGSLQGLTVHLRVGAANSKINRFATYTGAGGVYTGLIPGRDEDQCGLAVAGAHNGSEYMTLQRSAGNPVNRSEWNIEATYRVQLTPWLTLQPDVQYVIHPNTDPSRADVFAANLRFSISF